MGVFGNGYVINNIDSLEESYNSFINEYNNFNKLLNAIDILTENNIQIINESFGEKVKSLWSKFVGWVKSVFEAIGRFFKGIWKKITEAIAKAKAKNLYLKNAKIYNYIDKECPIDFRKIFIVYDVVKTPDLKESEINTASSLNDAATKEVEDTVKRIDESYDVEIKDFGKVDKDNETVFLSVIEKDLKKVEESHKFITYQINSAKDKAETTEKYLKSVPDDVPKDLENKFSKLVKDETIRGSKLIKALVRKANFIVEKVYNPIITQLGDYNDKDGEIANISKQALEKIAEPEIIKLGGNK